MPATKPVIEEIPKSGKAVQDDPTEEEKDNKPAGKSEQEDPSVADTESKPAEQDKEEQEPLPPPVQVEDPAKLVACKAELKAMGVTFEDAPAIADPGGCGISSPISVTKLAGGVKLEPEGQMRCETALQLARWTKDTVVPALKIAMPGEQLASVNQASTYICRKRNNAETGKISEHAHGNAVDIAGFTFASGETFSIEPRQQDSTLQGAFQRAITAAACLYFTTVLDPGSDSAHEKHLHLDVIERKNGYRLCW